MELGIVLRGKREYEEDDCQGKSSGVEHEDKREAERFSQVVVLLRHAMGAIPGDNVLMLRELAYTAGRKAHRYAWDEKGVVPTATEHNHLCELAAGGVQTFPYLLRIAAKAQSDIEAFQPEKPTAGRSVRSVYSNSVGQRGYHAN